MPAAGAIGVVKRLSTKSGKRMIAFKNEVELMSKLRHRNLMRILGCFVELVEKMLIYKYIQWLRTPRGQSLLMVLLIKRISLKMSLAAPNTEGKLWKNTMEGSVTVDFYVLLAIDPLAVVLRWKGLGR
ncbi:hypothetical protein F2Q69_00021652 [Brassica cretica]|uniref:Serine-threonine/tyrosine-protein kinase catalytic domain-containing protein n=2 Tax=Brassica TaxID=3705 RepID=A0A0D3ASL9_BRAOL|nr:hypothetical protein F2Q69_00021652 [Brassica cretica]